MSRIITLKATLNFEFDSHAELTSMRSAVDTFCTNNNGEYDIITREDSDASELGYTGKLQMVFENIASRGAAATLMGTIDGALSGLPDLYNSNGYLLRYNYVEDEDGS